MMKGDEVRSKRGFVTIATGDERYFKMARNLLYSYRLFSKKPCPFAIITDRENEYTKEFDDVILLENCTCSYMDKLLLLKLCPYQENLFVDADCVAYRDLNLYWNVFENADDFSCLGEVWDLDDKQHGWFQLPGAGKYQSQVKYIPNFHGGIYYIRPGKICDQMYEIAKDVSEHFDQYQFKSEKPADEPILALAMAVCGCYTIKWKPYYFICFWNAKTISANIWKGKLAYSTEWFDTVEDGMLLHWGNAFTTKSLYKFEAEKLDILYKKKTITMKEKILYGFRVKLLWYYFLKAIEKLKKGRR